MGVSGWDAGKCFPTDAFEVVSGGEVFGAVGQIAATRLELVYATAYGPFKRFKPIFQTTTESGRSETA
jgi:hypothetical protein